MQSDQITDHDQNRTVKPNPVSLVVPLVVNWVAGVALVVLLASAAASAALPVDSST